MLLLFGLKLRPVWISFAINDLGSQDFDFVAVLDGVLSLPFFNGSTDRSKGRRIGAVMVSPSPPHFGLVLGSPEVFNDETTFSER